MIPPKDPNFIPSDHARKDLSSPTNARDEKITSVQKERLAHIPKKGKVYKPKKKDLVGIGKVAHECTVKLPKVLAAQLSGKKSQTKIPNITHMIWFGGVPDGDDKKNIEKIAKTEKDKTVILWYSESQLRMDGKLTEMQSFMKGLNAPNIKFVPIEAIPKKKLKAEDQKLHDRAMTRVHEEISFSKDHAEMRNYAAGSDISRVFILKLFGGIYLDVDSPLVKQTKDLSNSHGILVNYKPKSDFINNSRLASVPQGKVITKLLENVLTSYDKLRTDSKKAALYEEKSLTKHKKVKNEIQKKRQTFIEERKVLKEKITKNSPWSIFPDAESQQNPSQSMLAEFDRRRAKQVELEKQIEQKEIEYNKFVDENELDLGEDFAHRDSRHYKLHKNPEEDKSQRVKSTIMLSGPRALNNTLKQLEDEFSMREVMLPEEIAVGEGPWKGSWF